MPARWTGRPLSLNGFCAAIQSRSDIECERQPAKVNGAAVLAVRFLKKSAAGAVVARTAPMIIEDPDRALSAGTVARWCETLGIDPSTVGLDETWS